jgi:hypothetical protein
MTVSCFPPTEGQLQQIVQLLREAGLFSNYGEQARGERILVSVYTRSLDEREKVKAIFRRVGITEFLYGDEKIA